MAKTRRNPERRADGLEVVRLSGAAEWEAWLQDHHDDGPGVWLALGRKGCAVPSLDYGQALEVALCFGWIDGQTRALDDQFTLRRFTPRRARSKWSEINCAHAERLIAAGRMRAPGLAQIEAARADGRWDAAYAPASTIEVPADLQTALDADPEAAAFFATLKSSDRYAYLYRLHHVTDPARRSARIAGYIERLGNRQTL